VPASASFSPRPSPLLGRAHFLRHARWVVLEGIPHGGRARRSVHNLRPHMLDGLTSCLSDLSNAALDYRMAGSIYQRLQLGAFLFVEVALILERQEIN